MMMMMVVVVVVVVAVSCNTLFPRPGIHQKAEPHWKAVIEQVSATENSRLGLSCCLLLLLLLSFETTRTTRKDVGIIIIVNQRALLAMLDSLPAQPAHQTADDFCSHDIISHSCAHTRPQARA